MENSRHLSIPQNIEIHIETTVSIPCEIFRVTVNTPRNRNPSHFSAELFEEPTCQPEHRSWSRDQTSSSIGTRTVALTATAATAACLHRWPPPYRHSWIVAEQVKLHPYDVTFCGVTAYHGELLPGTVYLYVVTTEGAIEVRDALGCSSVRRTKLERTVTVA